MLLTTQTWIVAATGAFVLLVVAMLVLIFKLLGLMGSLKKSAQDMGGRAEELYEKATALMEHVDKEIKVVGDRLDRVEAQVNAVMGELGETLRLTRSVEEAVLQRIKSIDPILDSTAQMAKDLEAITHDVRRKVRQVSDFFNAAEDAAHTMRSVTGVVRGGLLGAAIEIASLATGAKASLEYITKRFERNRRRREKGGK